MNLWKKVLLIVVILGLAGGLLVYHLVYNKAHPDFERLPSDEVLTAQALYDEFIADAGSASALYNGKVLEVSGTVSLVEQADDMVIVVFAFSDGLFGEEGVRCTMLSHWNEEALQLEEGDDVVLKGFCAGFTGNDVILEHCSIL